MPDKNLPQDEQNNQKNDVNPAELLLRLKGQLSEGELKDLCVALDVDYEGLPAVGKNDKARELVGVMLAEANGDGIDLPCPSSGMGAGEAIGSEGRVFCRAVCPIASPLPNVLL
ncbi:MAG: hypothetical protein DWQ04_33630 [Chloroflexi bacterium]|nr:MAG: hypothetical protein DWQ04_33630 [Chloroflexota bacterium]